MNIVFGLLGESIPAGSTSLVISVNNEINWTIRDEEEVVHCTIVSIYLKKNKYTFHDMISTYISQEWTWTSEGGINIFMDLVRRE